MMPAIEVCGLTKRFREVTAVENLTFAVQPSFQSQTGGQAECGEH
jgi:hypothetical protein